MDEPPMPCPWCGEKPTDPFPDDDSGLVICRCTKSPDWRMPVSEWNNRRTCIGNRPLTDEEEMVKKLAIKAERERCARICDEWACDEYCQCADHVRDVKEKRNV